MLRFNDYLLISEGLIIVKKGLDSQVQPYEIIHVEGFNIIPSQHIKSNRESASLPRDNNITKKQLTNIFKRAIANGLKDIEGTGHLIVKNKDSNWDDYIIAKQGSNITIISMILQGRKSKDSYNIKDNDFKLIIEKFKQYDFTLILG